MRGSASLKRMRTERDMSRTPFRKAARLRLFYKHHKLLIFMISAVLLQGCRNYSFTRPFGAPMDEEQDVMFKDAARASRFVLAVYCVHCVLYSVLINSIYPVSVLLQPILNRSFIRVKSSSTGLS